MVVETKLNIGGTFYDDMRDMLVISSIGENNSSSSFKIIFPNLSGNHKTDFSIGNEVGIWADKDSTPATTKIFTGIVENIKFKGRFQREIIELEGRDFTAKLMDSTVEPVVFNNTEVSSIVTSIISDNVEDITTNNVETTTTTLNYIAFNHIPVFDALRQLAELSGSTFFVDTDKDLHFVTKSSTSSGVTLAAGTNIIESRFKINDKELYNRVWVYGDRELTGIRDKFQGDGTGSIFNLSYRPHNTEVLVGGTGSVTMQGGIFEVVVGAPTSGIQYLVDFDQQKIIFTSGTEAGNNIPAGNASIFVDYDRSTPIIKFGETRDSVTNFGVHTKVVVDKNIKDPQMASDQVVSILNQSSEPATEGTIEVEGILVLTAGDTIIVNEPFYNINNITYDILEVKYAFNKENNFADKVLTVRVSRRLKNVTDTIKQLILDIKKLQADDIDTADVISRLEFGTGSFTIKVKDFFVKTRTVGSSFILGHPHTNPGGEGAGGILGSIVASGINFLGDSRSAFTNNVIGNLGEYEEDFSTTIYRDSGVTDASWTADLLDFT